MVPVGAQTLLNTMALGGRGEGGVAVQGYVHIDGRPCGKGYRRSLAYVPQVRPVPPFLPLSRRLKSVVGHWRHVGPPWRPVQEDALLETLTVRESVRYSALLRLPWWWSMEHKEARVDEVLEELGLARVAHVRVGHVGMGGGARGISGGERRRVSIAQVVGPSLPPSPPSSSL